MAFSTHDQVPDSPTNVFATLNPLNKDSDLTISNGNLQVTSSTSASHSNVLATIHSVGQNIFYIELTFSVALSGTTAFAFYLADPSYVVTNTHPQSASSGAWGIYTSTGASVISNGTGIFNPTSPSTNSILQLVYNSSTGDGWLGVNNVFYNSSGGTTGNPSSGTNPTFTNLPNNLTVGVDVIGSQNLILNFGQDPTFGGATGLPTAPSGSPFINANGIGKFYYSPPTGALALCTANLPSYPDLPIDPALDDLPEDYFKAVKYSGQTNETGVSTWDSNTSTGTVICGFPVDLAWIKVRNFAGSHRLYDTVRGANKILSSNTTSGEQTFANEVIGFNSTGFNVGNASANASGATYVAWCFRAGGNDNTFNWGDGTGSSTYSGIQSALSLPASSTSGMITPSGMSVNQKAGFSIVKYSGNSTVGATVPHGLSAAPEFIVIKNLDSLTNWTVYHIGTSTTSPENYRLKLNSSDGIGTTVNYWNNTKPNSSVVTLYSGSGVNESNNLVMYCWHSVAGYSAFGSYTGNGSTTGKEPFVYTGFRPAWLIIKRSDVTNDGWYIYDNARSPYNVVTGGIRANSASQEDGTQPCDFFSNGFRIRIGANGNFNANNGIYIYAAFAEQPFKYATAR